jgi:hypothetical protein
MTTAKTKRRRAPPPITQTREYQVGYHDGLQLVAALVRDACDVRDVPAVERKAAALARNRILDALSTAMHEIEACGRSTHH